MSYYGGVESQYLFGSGAKVDCPKEYREKFNIPVITN